MPGHNIGNPIGFVDSRKADPQFQSGVFDELDPIENYGDTEDFIGLKQALVNFDQFTYSAQNMEKMSLNDLIFAWRVCRGNEKSIADYMPAQTPRSS